ncbi:MAG: U32 family peptidase [Desulfobacterales bacterium]
MKLTLAANYDPELIPKLKPYPVEEVYGKLPFDCVGGGRAGFMGTSLSEKKLAGYVSELERHGIHFNYLLNSSCTGNREWQRSWQKKVMRLIEKLGDMGIRRLTVSTPYMMELIKKRFPEFFVKIGIYAQVDTPRRAKFWEELGADAINLESFSINRNFPRLAAIREAVDCELQLIANHPCLPNCAMQPYHQNGFAHASDGSKGVFIDYCFLRCSEKRLADPSLYIKSAWIRPEDLHVYEALGYSTFKLIERNIPSSELLKRVVAYSQRTFQGNLAELLLPYGFKETPPKGISWIVKHFFKPIQISPFKIKALYELVRSQGMLFPQAQSPVWIESSRIPDDFIQGFEHRDCEVLSCDRCGYCADIAAAAVFVDDDFRKEALAKYDTVHASMINGGLWNVRLPRH